MESLMAVEIRYFTDQHKNQQDHMIHYLRYVLLFAGIFPIKIPKQIHSTVLRSYL